MEKEVEGVDAEGDEVGAVEGCRVSGSECFERFLFNTLAKLLVLLSCMEETYLSHVGCYTSFPEEVSRSSVSIMNFYVGLLRFKRGDFPARRRQRLELASCLLENNKAKSRRQPHDTRLHHKTDGRWRS